MDMVLTGKNRALNRWVRARMDDFIPVIAGKEISGMGSPKEVRPLIVTG
jgi:hypothetical protein